MDGYGPSTYGDAFADVYDDWYAQVTDTTACVATVAELAREVPGVGPVLELGIGTGRLALPLAGLGLDVRGIDASDAMLERLAAKQGSHRAPGREAPVLAARGDFAAPFVPVRDDESAAPAPRLVLCAYNTLFNLSDLDAQRRCLTGVARLLAPGGRFVVEAFVPPGGAPTDQPDDVVRVRHLTADAVVLTASVHDPEAQRIEGHHVELRASGTRLRPWSVRYLTVGQLDREADAAGLDLEHRWAGWDGAPFDERARDHVSVYRRR